MFNPQGGAMPNTSQLLANHQLLLSQQQLANLSLLDHQVKLLGIENYLLGYLVVYYH